MQKLFSAEQIRAADQYTIRNEPISSLDLMKGASESAFSWFCKKYPDHLSTSFSIFCGTGNNGGDGLVIARLLTEQSYSVEVFVVNVGKYSHEFEVNLQKLTSQPVILDKDSLDFKIKEGSIIIDAIFGIGLNKPIEGFTSVVIERINSHSGEKISIDIPSGLFVENNADNKDNIVKANITLSFQFPKLAFLFPENKEVVGSWEIIEIGLSDKFIRETPTDLYYITFDDAQLSLKERDSFSHKGTYGHALLIAGSEGKMGAAILAIRGCLRSGVGLVTARTPRCGLSILQNTVPEAMVLADTSESFLKEPMDTSIYSSIGIGPGIGTNDITSTFLTHLLEKQDKPIVFDADALNLLAKRRELLQQLPTHSILSPHPTEFKRLVGVWHSDYERLQKQIQFSKKYNVFVILKGRNTSISSPKGNVYFNSTGNSGMATGGSGDVLTGILTSFLAQGYQPLQACIIGVYLHGLAGDIAAKELSLEAMLPSDIIKYLGKGFKQLKKKITD